MWFSESMFNGLYLAHAIIVWGGALREIAHIYRWRSAKDVAKAWIACLLVAELLALPRALSSGYWVWGLCHIVASCLIVILLIGVLKYQ